MIDPESDLCVCVRVDGSRKPPSMVKVIKCDGCSEDVYSAPLTRQKVADGAQVACYECMASIGYGNYDLIMDEEMLNEIRMLAKLDALRN